MRRAGTQGAGSNDKRSGIEPPVAADREALGRSRGGLSTKIHLAADTRCRLLARVTTATIPVPSNQVAGRLAKGSQGGRPPTLDPEMYKQRNTVERAINRIRTARAVATRYDKREFVYKGTIDVATIRLWLRDPVRHDSRDTA